MKWECGKWMKGIFNLTIGGFSTLNYIKNKLRRCQDEATI
jgi:hypothetical protein